MVTELQKHIDSEMVLFGLRESLKNSKKISKLFVAKDARQNIMRQLNEKNMDVEVLSLNKRELNDKLALGFECEVFGIKR